MELPSRLCEISSEYSKISSRHNISDSMGTLESYDVYDVSYALIAMKPIWTPCHTPSTNWVCLEQHAVRPCAFSCAWLNWSFWITKIKKNSTNSWTIVNRHVCRYQPFCEWHWAFGTSVRFDWTMDFQMTSQNFALAKYFMALWALVICIFLAVFRWTTGGNGDSCTVWLIGSRFGCFV